MFRLLLIAVLATSASCVYGRVLQDKVCREAGFFAVVDNTKDFYGCFQNKDGELTLKYLTCREGEVFNVALGACIPREKVLREVDDGNNSEIEYPTSPDDSSSTSGSEIEHPTIPTEAPSKSPDSSSSEPLVETTEAPSTTDPPAESTTEEGSEGESTESTEAPVESTTEESESSSESSEAPEESTTEEGSGSEATEAPVESTTEESESSSESSEAPEESTTEEGSGSEATEAPVESTTEESESSSESSEAPEESTTEGGSGSEATEAPVESTTEDSESSSESSEAPEESTTEEDSGSESSSESPDVESTTESEGSTSEEPSTEVPSTTTESEPDETTTPEAFICPSDGFFPDNNVDVCNNFIYCTTVDGVLTYFRMECPQGQQYNPETGYCQADFNCIAEKVAEQMGRQFKRDIQCLVEGVFHDPKDCSKYYTCSWNENFEAFEYHPRQCRDGEVFHLLTGQCAKEEALTCLGRSEGSRFGARH